MILIIVLIRFVQCCAVSFCNQRDFPYFLIIYQLVSIMKLATPICTYFVVNTLLQWKSRPMLCSHWQDSKTCFTWMCDSSDLLLDFVLDCWRRIWNGVSIQGKSIFLFTLGFILSVFFLLDTGILLHIIGSLNV
jgi:hypothetical protein